MAAGVFWGVWLVFANWSTFAVDSRSQAFTFIKNDICVKHALVQLSMSSHHADSIVAALPVAQHVLSWLDARSDRVKVIQDLDCSGFRF
jgi:hypothetical protein